MTIHSELDHEYIRKAERVTSFDVGAHDFQSLQFKQELQHLFIKHMFNGFDPQFIIKGNKLTTTNVNTAIERLALHGDIAKLHRYNVKGIGPGEVMMYFLVHNAMLGGGSSKGLDVYIGNNGYEIKAVMPLKKTYYADFKLGGTIALDGHKMELASLQDKLGLGGSATEIPSGMMTLMQSQDPNEYERIEEEFRTNTYNNYFKHHKTIFINNRSTKGQIGRLLDIRQVTRSQIFMERVTSGTLKPLVKI